MSPRADPTRVLFIGGVGRSGTTLIERTLDTDARVVVLGEVMHLWERSLVQDELCGCGRAFSKCPFWQDIGLRAFGGWHHVDPVRLAELKGRLDRASRTPQLRWRVGSRRWRADLHEYGEYYARIYGAARDITGAHVVVDSSKQASLPYVLRHQSTISLRLLHCLRDSRAVAHSWTRTVRRPEAQNTSGELMQRYSPAKMSFTWMLHNIVLEALSRSEVPHLRLRYEDWVSDPAAALIRILRFCALPDRPTTSAGPTWVDLGVSHTCSGNPMRFAHGRVEVTPDKRWQREFVGRDRWLVTLATLPLLRAYRYRGSS